MVPAGNDDGCPRMLSFVQSSSEGTSLAVLVVPVVSSVVFDEHEGGFCCELACPALI